MRKLFNKEQENFIISNYLTMKYADIAKSLGNYTAAQITTWLNSKGYKKGHNSIFSKSDIEYMKNNCKMKDEYRKRADDFFCYSDRNNCERIYEEMIKYQNKLYEATKK